jgi:hypothetical protein
MAGIENNLYPPIIASWMPAFVRTTSCRIYFSLSTYNSIEDIKNVQVIINNQSNNLSALDSEKYPAGIKITNLNTDNEISGDSKYYITISPSDLENGVFELNQYYKVQIRFTGTGAANVTDSQKIASWLTNNQKYFSEWSTVCLIKGIQQPRVYIKGFEEDSSSSETIFTTELIDIIGGMYYDENNETEKEYLKSYQIIISNAASDEMVFDSGIVYTNTYNPNEINYTLEYALDDGVNYKLELIYTTNNEYSNSQDYYFSIIQGGNDPLNADITATIDNDNGRIRIDVVSTTTDVFMGNVTIRRSSSKTNFTIWEDIQTAVVNEGKPLDLTWYDYTAESGIWYKYCAQKRSSRGERGLTITIRNPVMLDLEDLFLTNQDMQLKIKYNPTISSFKQTISESRTETLGSQYPFIRRNSALNYKQFPISGLITSFCDEDELFVSKESVYGDFKEDYADYNTENQIDAYGDIIYEKNFRDKIMEFLYDGSVKLFRSNTEGNILVKVMDVSFTPNATLGRMLYSFSATAYEVDECSISNYNNYNILTIGDYSSYIEYLYTKVGQISGTYSGSGQNVFSDIQSQHSDGGSSGYVNEVNYLQWLRLSFESDPYLVQMGTDGSLIPATAPSQNCLLGYIVYINGNATFVNRNGVYELADDDTIITSIWFPTKTEITIDYIAQIEQFEDTSDEVSKLYYYTKAGQIYDIFESGVSVSNQIYLKYLENYDAYYQKLLSLNQITVEAEPGTVLYLKDSFDSGYFRHVIGETGRLEFYDDEAVIEGFYFKGIHLSDLTNYEVKEEDGEKKIFYNGQWYTLNDNNDVECPIEALVDYIYEIVKGEY